MGSNLRSQTDSDRPPAGALSCAGVTVLRDGRRVLHDVSITIQPGECVTLIGPNGAGKTTLLLTLLGLLPPAAGEVRLGTRELRRLSARERGRFASYVPQTIERLPAFTVGDVVAAGRFPHVPPLYPLSGADHAAIDAALGQCGLEPLRHRRVSDLSGGERQKTLIAAALAQDAAAMFLDEPNTALDPAVQLELARLLREWHARGRTLVLVSHDLHLPAVLGGRVVALRDGGIIADAPAADLLRPERLEAVYHTRFAAARMPGGRELVVPDWWP